MVRSFGIIYIIGVVHPLFWKGYTLDPILKSFALIEMPFIFFAMGASAAISNPKHTALQGIIARLKRLLLPYLAYIVVVILAENLYRYAISRHGYEFSPLNIAASILWTFPTTDLPYVRMHLWFIPVALLFALFGSAIYRALRTFAVTTSMQRALLILLFLGIPLLAERLAPPAVAQFFFYLPWFLAGALLIANAQIFSPPLVVACSLLGLALFCGAYFYGVSMDMQTHKFAPDRYFMWYTLAVVPVILFVIKLFDNKLPSWVFKEISWWANESYLAYLWQSFAYLLISFGMIKWNFHVTDWISTLTVGAVALLLTRIIVTGIRLLTRFSTKVVALRYTSP